MKALLLSFVFGLSVAIVLANGGPIDGSYVQKSGNIVLIEEHQVRLLEEYLSIEIDGDYCNVSVRYLLKNEGESKAISYGFPVDFISSDEGSYYPDLEYVEKFTFQVDGKIVSHSTKQEDNLKSESILSCYGGADGISRKWYITKIPFEGQTTHVLEVKYRILSNFCNYMGGVENYFSGFSYRTFLYDLKPAGFWGDGTITIGKFSIAVKKPQRLSTDEIKIKGIEELTYANDTYTAQFDNYAVKEAKNLRIGWNQSASLLESEYREHLPRTIIKSVRASSTLKGNYQVENLFDGSPQTAWVEGAMGSGAGEWVEIEFKEGVFIAGMTILNGYTKNENVFTANGKVKRFTAEVVNVVNGQTHIQEYSLEYHQVDSLRNYSFQDFSERGMYQTLDVLFDAGNPDMLSPDELGSTTKIRFTITEVYAGSRYEDTCISEFFFYGDQK
ncbi:MAG: discoidin domain-containing protein [Bacteroidota bacterium]